MEITILQIHNVLRTYLPHLKSGEVDPASDNPETSHYCDRVTLSSDSKQKLETLSESKEK